MGSRNRELGGGGWADLEEKKEKLEREALQGAPGAHQPRFRLTPG